MVNFREDLEIIRDKSILSEGQSPDVSALLEELINASTPGAPILVSTISQYAAFWPSNA